MVEDRNLQIAIVGAGVSGIFTAIELKKRGYTNVTLYEKSDRIASLTHTFTLDNYNFDFSTKLIPSIGLTHDGIYPPLLELIRATGVTLSAPPVPRFYDFHERRFMELPVTLQRFKKTKIISDFAKAYELLLQINECSSLAEVVSAGLIQPGENVDSWAERNGIQAFGAFTNYIVDLFNIGPSYLVPAEFVLVSRVHFLAPYLHAVLGKNGVRHYFKLFKGGRSKSFLDFLDFEKKDTNYYLINEGYVEFFRRLVAHYDLNVRCNSHLSGMSVDENGVKFTINDVATVECSKLIFCCPPPAIAALVPDADVKQLLGNIHARGTIRTWAFEADSWDSKTFGDSAYIIDGSNSLAIGTSEFNPNGELMYITRETAGSSLMVSAVYLGDNAAEDERRAALDRSLRNFNLSLRKIVTYKDFCWPHHASLQQTGNNWNERIEVLQARNGLYYSGECLSGIGVPTILEHTIRFAGRHFNSIT